MPGNNQLPLEKDLSFPLKERGLVGPNPTPEMHKLLSREEQEEAGRFLWVPLEWQRLGQASAVIESCSLSFRTSSQVWG